MPPFRVSKLTLKQIGAGPSIAVSQAIDLARYPP
jgi:hypothetical protein